MKLIHSIYDSYMQMFSKNYGHFHPKELLYSKYNLLEFMGDAANILSRTKQEGVLLINTDKNIHFENISWQISFDALVRKKKSRNHLFRYYKKSTIRSHKTVMYSRRNRKYQKVFQWHFIKNQLEMVSLRINHINPEKFSKEDFIRSLIYSYLSNNPTDWTKHHSIVLKSPSNQLMIIENKAIYLNVICLRSVSVFEKMQNDFQEQKSIEEEINKISSKKRYG